MRHIFFVLLFILASCTTTKTEDFRLTAPHEFKQLKAQLPSCDTEVVKVAGQDSKFVDGKQSEAGVDFLFKGKTEMIGISLFNSAVDWRKADFSGATYGGACTMGALIMHLYSKVVTLKPDKIDASSI